MTTMKKKSTMNYISISFMMIAVIILLILGTVYDAIARLFTKKRATNDAKNRLSTTETQSST